MYVLFFQITFFYGRIIDSYCLVRAQYDIAGILGVISYRDQHRYTNMYVSKSTIALDMVCRYSEAVTTFKYWKYLVI